MPFYCLNVPSKIFYASMGAEFLRISRAASKIEDLSRSCKQLNVKTRWANVENQNFLTKMTQRHLEVLIKYNKSIEQVMQVIGFKIQIKAPKSNIFFYIHFLHIYIFLHFLFFIYSFIISICNFKYLYILFYIFHICIFLHIYLYVSMFLCFYIFIHFCFFIYSIFLIFL